MFIGNSCQVADKETFIFKPNSIFQAKAFLWKFLEDEGPLLETSNLVLS